MNSADLSEELRRLELQYELETRKQQAEHAFQLQKAELEAGLEGRKEYARQTLEYALQYEGHLKDYAQLALRSAFLLNGGAVIALLTFIGSTVGKAVNGVAVSPALFVPAFQTFIAGLVLVCLAMTLAYYNYMGHHGAKADPGSLANNIIKQQGTWPTDYSTGKRRLVRWTHWLAVACGVLSLLAFIWGSVLVGRVLSGFPVTCVNGSLPTQA